MAASVSWAPAVPPQPLLWSGSSLPATLRRAACHRRPAQTAAVGAGGNVWEELTTVSSWGSRQFWEPSLRVLPWEGPRLLFSPVTEEPECAVPRSFLSLLGRGSPTGSCRGKLRSPPPGVGPHSGLINCSSLLPGLVTRPASWGLEFSENCYGFPFPIAWLTPIPRTALWRPGREEVGRGEQVPERLKLRWEGLRSRRKGQGRP